jgi:hypothetical protein
VPHEVRAIVHSQTTRGLLKDTHGQECWSRIGVPTRQETGPPFFIGTRDVRVVDSLKLCHLVLALEEARCYSGRWCPRFSPPRIRSLCDSWAVGRQVRGRDFLETQAT